ncbi:hypothetical protein AB9K26_07605 [Psychroserpens sp. XS_ASV72]|uniref:hypothetical protein n=1 Tax=Psychroserpens sp. XS_ASV72 TaxID=3241293 RepID=UPI0035141DC7
MKKQLLSFFLLSLFCFTSCDNVLECVFNKRPEIHDTTFGRGQVGVYYYAEVTTEIKNEANDDDYGYNYELYGDLPDGIQMFVNYRTVSFEGLPEVAGRYTFTLLLYVDPPLVYDEYSNSYQDNMCSHSTSKDFSIVIE